MIEKLKRYQCEEKLYTDLASKINEIIDYLPQEKEPDFNSQSVDARNWAKEFNRILVTKGQQPCDEKWLIGWFANAIMAGYYEVKKRVKQLTKEVPDVRIVDTNILWQKLQDRGFDHVQASETIKVIQEISVLYRKDSK